MRANEANLPCCTDNRAPGLTASLLGYCPQTPPAASLRRPRRSALIAQQADRHELQELKLRLLATEMEHAEELDKQQRTSNEQQALLRKQSETAAAVDTRSERDKMISTNKMKRFYSEEIFKERLKYSVKKGDPRKKPEYYYGREWRREWRAWR